MVEGGGGGSVIAAFFLAHNYLSEQFGNYVEYGIWTTDCHMLHVCALCWNKAIDLAINWNYCLFCDHVTGLFVII